MKSPRYMLLLVAGILIATVSCGSSDTAKKSSVSTNQSLAVSPGRPSSLPGDVPFYPGGKMESDTTQGDYRSITYTAPADFNAAFDYYESEFKRLGWEVGSTARATDPETAKAVGGVRINGQRKESSRLITCYVKIVPKTDNSCSINVQFPK